jgi:ABC-type antimicrobial peptide transport system permease subunit
MASGSMFSDQDVRSLAKSAVIGKTVADELFPNENPVGQTIRIRNLPFLIVGVLAPKGFNLFGRIRTTRRRSLHQPHAPHHHAHVCERHSGGGRQRQGHRQRAE